MQNKTNKQKSATKKNYRSNVKGSKKPFEKEEEFNRHAGSGCNDVNWYAVSEQVLKDTASYPFSKAVGNRVNILQTTTIPGIMVINFQPAIGYSEDDTSAVNIAAKKFYAYVRTKQSGSTNYQRSDQMMYFLAAGSLYAKIASFKRVYGLLNKFSSFNKYLGDIMVKSLGWDPDDLRANAAAYRKRANILINQLNQAIHVPKGLPYIERNVFMNSIVAIDHPGDKCQIYVPKQQTYFKFDPIFFNTGSSLVPAFGSSSGDINGSHFAMMDNMLQALISDDDISIMSGDIWKAYGSDGCFTLTEITEDFTTEYTYDVPFLAQIHNAFSPNVFAGPSIKWATDSTLTTKLTGEAQGQPYVYQKNNMIISRPIYSTNTKLEALKKGCILDIPVEHPTPGDVMESSRLISAISETRTTPVKVSGSATAQPVVLCGSEIVTSYNIVRIRNSGESAAPTYNQIIGLSELVQDKETFTKSDTANVVASELNRESDWSVFDWHPLLYIYTGNQSIPGSSISWKDDSYMFTIGDISNYTILSPSEIEDLHTSALMGMMDVPVFTVSK